MSEEEVVGYDADTGMPTDGVTRSAVLSPCGRYRYSLLRSWDESLPRVGWVMLNPSTADASVDDATILKCVRFARSWGYGSMVVVNLFAYRAREPNFMKLAIDPVGPENESSYFAELGVCREVVLAWGNEGSFRGRSSAVMKTLLGSVLADRLRVLGLTASGEPRHPLYLSGSLAPERLS